MKVSKVILLTCLLGLSLFLTSCATTGSSNGLNKDGTTTLSVPGNVKIQVIDGKKVSSSRQITIDPGFHRIECDVTDGLFKLGEIRIGFYFAEGFRYRIDEYDFGNVRSYDYRLDAPYQIKEVDAKTLVPASQEALEGVKNYGDFSEGEKRFTPICNMQLKFKREGYDAKDWGLMEDQTKQYAYELGADTIAFVEQRKTIGTLMEGYADFYIVTALAGKMK